MVMLMNPCVSQEGFNIRQNAVPEILAYPDLLRVIKIPAGDNVVSSIFHDYDVLNFLHDSGLSVP
jgi:hypothetical protein